MNKFELGITIIMMITSVVISKDKGIRMNDIALHPDYPVIENSYKMTNDWSVYLPGNFNRRIEDGSLVIWRPGLTIWTSIWNNDKKEPPAKRRDRVIQDASKDRFNEEYDDKDSLFYSYRLNEESDDKRVAAYYCFAFGENGHVQMAIYFDNEDDLKWARMIWKSLKEIKPTLKSSTEPEEK